MLCVQHDRPFCKGLSSPQNLLSWAQGAFKLQGGRSTKEGTCPNQPLEGVMAHIATSCHASSLFSNGPTTHWLGPETLVCLKIEGCEVNALADSSSQVNNVTPIYMHQHEFPILPLRDLVDYPLNLIGFGATGARPLGFVIL